VPRTTPNDREVAPRRCLVFHKHFDDKKAKLM